MSQKSSLNRLLTILKRLNKGKKIRIEHIADEFECSTRTVRRDFKLIQETFDDFLLKSGEDYYAIKKNILNDVLMGTDLATLNSVVEVFTSSGSKFKMDKNLQKKYENSKKIYKLTNKPFEELNNREVVAKLESAIDYRQVIKIVYKKIDKEIIMELKPYKIILLNENFYLASENSKGIFTLSRIGLIKNIETLSNTFYHNPKMLQFIDHKIQTPWGKFYDNGKDIEILVEVQENIARYFKMKKYLPSQKIVEEKEDGFLQIKYIVSNLSEFTELAIKWVPKMKILSPQKLSNMVEKELRYKLRAFE